MDKAGISEPVSGIVVNGQELTFVGIPTEAFYAPPSPFGDQKRVPLYFVKKTELHPELGFISWRENHKFPFKGIVTPEILEMVNISKRLLRDGGKFAVSRWYYWALNMAIPVWRKKFMWDVAEFYAEYSFHFLRRFYIKPEWCCPSVREYYRAAQKTVWDWNISTKQRWIVDKIVLAGGMFLECDDSYRYRVQDICGELDKSRFMKSPGKEIGRLMGILKERGIGAPSSDGVRRPDEVELRIRSLVFLLRVGFFLLPSWKKRAKRFVNELNLEKMKLDEGDRYFCMVRPDYQFGGIPFEERIAERKRIDGEMWRTNPQREFLEEK